MSQTLGVGGIATPAGATLATADTTAPLTITKAGIYDGGGHKVGRITVKASNVVVQNYRIVAGGQYSVVLDGDDITLRNCDISGLRPSGDGDLNAITAFGGDRVRILYNTAVNFVASDPGGSHTDFIQHWVSSSHPKAGKDWEIVGNKAVGPANPNRDPKIASIHQFVMVEGAGQGGNTGGSGKPSGWLIADNEIGDSWGQAIKLDGVENFVITRNRFVGSSDHVLEVTAASSGVTFLADNVVGAGYGSVGVPIAAGPGQPAPVPSGGPMTDAAQILSQFGNHDPQSTITAAALEHIELALAAAMLEKESNARNVWGSDPVSTGGAYVKGSQVTRENYLAYRALVQAGKIGRQGVGPAQLTSKGYQDSGDALGGCWDPVANMRSGFRGLGNLVRTYGVQQGARRYNGSGPAAEAYGRAFLARYNVWKSRLAGVTVPDVSAIPEEDELKDDERAALIGLYHQMSGSPEVGKWPGWPTWPGGTGESLTLLDYLRRQNKAMAELAAKVDALAARIKP